MKAFALFENKSIKCRVKIVSNGKVETKDFDQVSKLVNYCNEHSIDIPISNCYAVDDLPNFNSEED